MRVGEHAIGFGELLELDFRRLVIGIAVRVILHGELAIGLFQLVPTDFASDPKRLVKISFGHRNLSRRHRAAALPAGYT